LAVAALAGVPAVVIARARERLRELEAGARRHAERDAVQLSLFPPDPEPAPPHPLLEAIEAIDPDALTPKAALELVYRLKDLSNDRGAKPSRAAP
jgi:DNA mismatch repair protein MutS